MTVTPAAVKETIENWLQRPRKEGRHGVQVAFFGGSFTGLPLPRQRELLESVQPFLDDGRVGTIRISTRPDIVDDAVAAFLRKRSVTIVELGIQSLDQDVLAASRRGHSGRQATDAIQLLKHYGFKVGAQLMCGLPGDTTVKLMATAKRTAALAPDFVRIYPALIIRGSGLDQQYRAGNYTPLSITEAVALCSRMKAIFEQHHIRVVRMGLQPSRALAEKVVAGPYHPAFGELVMARALFHKTRKLLRQHVNMEAKRLSIAAADESVFRGPENVSLKRLSTLGLLDGVEFILDKSQARGTVVVR